MSHAIVNEYLMKGRYVTFVVNEYIMKGRYVTCYS